jgi:hypothetical protein
MSDTLTTVLVSALTSGAVALGTEWAFKPRTEARKERLLELHRKRRELGRHMMTILTNAAKWASLDMDDTTKAQLAGEISRSDQAIEYATRTMNDELDEIAFSYTTRRIKNSVVGYIFAVRMVQISGRIRTDKLQLLKDITEPAHVWLFGSRWRPVARVLAMQRLEQRKYQ